MSGKWHIGGQYGLDPQRWHAGEDVYYPIEVEPYTPAHHFAKGTAGSRRYVFHALAGGADEFAAVFTGSPPRPRSAAAKN